MFYFFFFKQKTAYEMRISDWSSDVCSSDLLGELDFAIEAGAFAGVALNRVFHEYDTITARISWLHDVTDTHDGFIVTPALEYGTPLSRKAYAGLQLSADYVGQDFAATYYGVTPAGAVASGLSPFTIDEGWKNARLSLLGSYQTQCDLTTGGPAPLQPR